MTERGVAGVGDDGTRRLVGGVAAVLARLDTYCALLTARAATRRRLRRPVCRLLVVCYGNIYRSAFLGAYLGTRCKGRCEVRSGGFHAKTGRACPERLVARALALGVDLSAHRSSQVTEADLQWADTVLVMDRHNFHALRRRRVPLGKILWAGALGGGPVEIADPYEADDQGLARTVDRLVEAGDRLASRFEATA